MTSLLHLPARPGAPIACDMRAAADTPGERIAEYERLFADTLVRRERGEDTVVFALKATPGTREHVDDLARREAACCPFLDYRVETAGNEVIWTITGEQPGAATTLDAFYALGAGTTGRAAIAAATPIGRPTW